MNDKTLIERLEDAIFGIIKLRAEHKMLKHALSNMWFAYENKDGAVPHDFEEKAVAMAQKILGPWSEATKWLRRDWKGVEDTDEH